MTTFAPKQTETNVTEPRRSQARLLAPLDRLAETSQHLISRAVRRFERDGQTYEIPRYVFLGPKGGGDTIRIGIFATIHGDEPEGALALTRFVESLERHPELAQGYALFIYPVCNPTGFERNSRYNSNRRDLNRDFWQGSLEPEIRFLESEICLHAFDGIITLHTDDTSDGLYGYVGGAELTDDGAYRLADNAVLSENLLEPALREAEQFLPRNYNHIIDGFAADQGIIYASYNGVLRALPGAVRPPFEITFETPQQTSLHRQVEAFNAALTSILNEYRYLLAIGQNI